MSKAQWNLLVTMAVVILILGIEWLSNGMINKNYPSRDMGKLVGELLTVIPAGLLIYFALGYQKTKKKDKKDNET